MNRMYYCWWGEWLPIRLVKKSKKKGKWWRYCYINKIRITRDEWWL